MSMPKGFKTTHGYATAMSKFVSNTCSLYDVQPTREDITRISADPRFQSAILDMIKDMDA